MTFNNCPVIKTNIKITGAFSDIFSPCLSSALERERERERERDRGRGREGLLTVI